MIEKITDEELEFCECFYNPIAMAECLFSDYDNLVAMNEDELAHIRMGQLPLLSYEYLLDENPEISEKENFDLRKGSGDLYCLGGRLFGKTLFVEKVDLLISMATQGSERVGFSSYDAIHIRGVLEEVIQVLEHHPLFKIFQPDINRSPNYRITFPTGYLLESVNMNITGKKPGAQFFQKHFTRLYIEEASFETEQVYRQRRDSVSENGCVFRIAGMTNFTKYSPCGQVFYDLSKKSWVLNLPQYINPKWNDKEKQKAVKDFGGEQSVGFRVFIRGEVVEGGVSVFDMERIRPYYNEDRVTKNFEINKDNFTNFKTIIIAERFKNATAEFLFADIGDGSAPTEIGIIFEINKRYRYEYNITLYDLTDKEQFKIFKWLAETLKANYVALDCTDGTGRAIFRSLEEIFPKENLIWVSFNEKIAVDFERDANDKPKKENGKFVYKEEYVSEWSIKHLKDLLYDGRVDLPLDYKFDMQVNSVVAMQSGARTIYECISQENHLFQAFQVFSIAQWMNEFNLIKPVQRTDFFKSGV